MSDLHVGIFARNHEALTYDFAGAIDSPEYQGQWVSEIFCSDFHFLVMDNDGPKLLEAEKYQPMLWHQYLILDDRGVLIWIRLVESYHDDEDSLVFKGHLYEFGVTFTGEKVEDGKR